MKKEFESELPDPRYPPYDKDAFERKHFAKKGRADGTKDDADARPLTKGGYGSPGEF